MILGIFLNQLSVFKSWNNYHQTYLANGKGEEYERESLAQNFSPKQGWILQHKKRIEQCMYVHHGYILLYLQINCHKETNNCTNITCACAETHQVHVQYIFHDKNSFAVPSNFYHFKLTHDDARESPSPPNAECKKQLPFVGIDINQLRRHKNKQNR